MIKNIISRLKKNVTLKTIITFIVTFIIVWSDHNWRLVKTFFNIDSDRSFQEKMEYAKIFFSSSIIVFLKNLIVCILITCAVLILIYILIGIGKFIIKKLKR